ncbi:MAG: hypothetical protein IT265_00205 [Saprospiraceae bacterium]|nr:hypothetical protein [Saprospiraceae bacterium]
MKIFLLAFVLFNSSINLLTSQSQEVNRQMSLGIQNGISVSIPNADDKLINKIWKKYTDDYGKLNKNKKAKEVFIEGAKIKSIFGELPMDLYAVIEDQSIIVFFDIKSGFLGSKDHPKEFTEAQRFITEFGYEVQREQVRVELEDEQDKLKQFEKNLDKLKKDNISYNKDIEDAKEKIRKAEANIITNGQDQKKTVSEIESQSKIVDQVKNKLNMIGKSK